MILLLTLKRKVEGLHLAAGLVRQLLHFHLCIFGCTELALKKKSSFQAPQHIAGALVALWLQDFMAQISCLCLHASVSLCYSSSGSW